MIILYLFAVFLIVLESSIINLIFYLQCIVWDPLGIFIILVALYSKKLGKDIYRFTFIVSILQDLFTFGYGVNLVSKMLLVLWINFLREKFFVSSFLIKSITVILLSFFELLVKTAYSFIFFKHFAFCAGYIVYIVLNFAIFYIYYLIKEKEVNTKIE